MDPTEPDAVVTALAAVKQRVLEATTRRPHTAGSVTLVAVSKTKPLEMLMAAYGAGQRDFGENYVQEIVQKAPGMPADVRWHFIGHLQTNKVKELLGVAGLACVHTVDSLKLAQELQKRLAQMRPEQPLDVLVQVNTSAETSKSGCEPAACAALCREIIATCPLLRLQGLMCIGKYSSSEGSAEADFVELANCRLQVAEALGRSIDSLCLSMGMSHDFEGAIAAGATHVRVGSTIFGVRSPKV